VISLVIDQSQPEVFYLQEMMNFMKPGVLYLQKMMNFMKPWVLYLQKIMNFMKLRTLYKKLPLFIKKNSILHTYKKTPTSNMSFYKKNSIFGTFRDPCVDVPSTFFHFGSTTIFSTTIMQCAPTPYPHHRERFSKRPN